MKNCVLFLFVAISGIGCNAIKGNGNIKEENRQVPDFVSVKTVGSIDVEFNPGTAIGVKVISDENVIPYVVTEVSDGELRIHYKEGVSIVNSHTHVVVSAPTVKQFSSGGSGNISSKVPIESNQIIELRSTGSGDINVQVNAPAVKIVGTGSGDFKIGGFTKDMTAVMSGSGDLDCKDLKAETVDIKIAGSSDAKVFASNTLKANISGSGNVLYWGNPSLPSISVSGSGKVKAGEGN